MDEDPKEEANDIRSEILKDFHHLMIEALRQREGDIIQFVAILGAALAGFGWLAKVSTGDQNAAELSAGVFIIGTAGVLFLLIVGAAYTGALGYNYRYITMQLAKIEVKLRASKSMLAKWPRSPKDFRDKYGCYCLPPEILAVFYLAFLFAIVGVTLSAALLRPEPAVLWIVSSLGVLFSLIGWLIPCRYGRKIRNLVSAEEERGDWQVDCTNDNQRDS